MNVYIKIAELLAGFLIGMVIGHVVARLEEK